MDTASSGAQQHVVSGRVQGVAFRWSTRRTAKRLGLAGFVRNLTDGRVEVWAEGDRTALSKLERWLARGPDAACVEQHEHRGRPPKGLAGFRIESDADEPG